MARRCVSWHSLAVALGIAVGSSGPAHAGAYSSVITWDEIPIHAALLPNGKIMTFGATPQDGQGGFDYTIWDPTQGTGSNAFVDLPNGVNFNSFCVGGVLNPGDDSIFLAGGLSNEQAVKYTYQTDALTLFNTLTYPRYYASMTTLPNGQVLTNGGAPPYGNQSNVSTIPEIFTPGQGWTTLPGAATNSPMQVGDPATTGNPFWYPHEFYVGNSQLFVIAGKYTYYLNYSGQGSVNNVQPFTQTNYGATSTAVMYRPGMVMQIGGGSYGNDTGDGNLGSNLATVFNLTNYPATSTNTTMALPRHFPTATVMADGEVLVTGGSQVNNQVNGVAYQAEIYNPANGQWRLDATMQTPRLYHSIALLMKDGRVMVGGGGAPGPVAGHTVEIYTPDYLLDVNHVPAVRPSIVNAPGRVALGQTFNVATDSPISRMTLVKTGVVTHSFNTDQRFFELTFTAAGTNSYSVTFPNDAINATPGLYMLFAFNQSGVPSVGKYLRLPAPLGDDGSSVPNDLPTPTTPTGSGLTAGQWLDCATENGTCTVPGTTTVRFGANGNWLTSSVTGSIACTNAAFGSDPAQGLIKSCQYQVAAANIANYGGAGTGVWAGTSSGTATATGNGTSTTSGTVTGPGIGSSTVGTPTEQATLPIGVSTPLLTNNAGLCVGVQGDSTADGAPIITWTCNQGRAQSWQLVPQGVGYAVVNAATGKCLDVNNWGVADGTTVQQWTCTGGTNQTWMPTETASGLSLVASHSNKCLDVAYASTASGATVWQWTCNGNSNQAFHKEAGNGTLEAGAEMSFQATTACCTSQDLRHQGTAVGLATIATAADQQNATWIVHPGLAQASCVSFESGNTPGNYLRHYNFILYAQANDGSAQFAADATFCPVAGLSGKGTSFQSYNYANKYIRHYNWNLYIASNGGSNAWDATASYNDDVSWIVTQPLQPATLPTGTNMPLLTNGADLCVSVQGGSTADGASIIADTCQGGASQSWQLVSQGAGFAVVNASTGKCLDVYNFGTSDGAQVGQWTCNGGTNQTWIPTQTASGVSLVASHSNKCLAVQGGATAPGTVIFQWTCDGTPSQAYHTQ